MDTATHPSSSTVSNPGLFNISSHNNVSHHSPRPRRYHYPHTRGGFHVPITRKSQQLNKSPGHVSLASHHPSPGLLPLICKFEDLDAESLIFNVRDAQPPHLRLPGSRMGGRDQRADLQQLKTTRERLLTLFDKPGWGAGTLRALRDGDGRKFDESPFGEERGPSRTQRNASLKQDECPKEEYDHERWIPIPRPRLRHESRIRERIEFFNSGTDCPPSGNHSSSRLKVADGTFPSQSPTRPQQIASLTKGGRHFLFPSNHNEGALTPTRSYGYLRPKETTPLPWRPLDSRRWEAADHRTGSPDMPKVRGRPREQTRHSLIIPVPTAAASAVKKVQITHQDAKRIVSEKISVFHVSGSKERVQERSNYEMQSKGPSSALVQYPEVTSSTELVTDQDTGGESAVEAKNIQETNNSKLEEGPALVKKCKMQDRANLFTNNGPNTSNFTVSMARMRNQSTPTKLPSEAAYIISPDASSRLPRLIHNGKLQAGECSAQAKTVNATSIPASDLLLEAIAERPYSKPHDTAPQMSSVISDKIQHFESFTSGHTDSTRKVVVNNNNGKFSSPQSKRIHTWPIPASAYFSDLKAEQTMLLEKSTRQTQIRHGFSNHKINKNSPIPNSITTRNDMTIRTYEAGEGTKQKFQARHECLTRRLRSRSRSAPGMSALTKEQVDTSRASEQTRQAFGADASTETRRMAAEKVGRHSGTTLLLQLDATAHQQHAGAERVHEIWVDGSEDGPPQEVVIVDTVVAQCALAEPRPMRLAETLRMIRLCRGRFGERSGTWRRKLGRTSEKGGGFAA